MDLTLLTVFWLLSAAIVLFFHAIIARFGNRVPDVLKAVYMFGKQKVSSGFESKCIFPVPKSWFTHFYAFGLFIHSLLLILLCLQFAQQSSFLSSIEDFWKFLQYPSTNMKERNALPVIIVFIAEWLQMARRLQECLSINSFSKTTMSPIHYFYGMFLYSSFGIGLLSSTDVTSLKFDKPSTSDLISYLPVAFLFLLASYYQHQTFLTFASLRKAEKGNEQYAALQRTFLAHVKVRVCGHGTINHQLTTPSTDVFERGGCCIMEKGKPARGHFIPKGHLFRWVSCPHYLCEIIIYISLCLVFNMKSAYLNSVLAFVVINQISSGLMSHDWYLKSFKNYPRNRKAVLPYIL